MSNPIRDQLNRHKWQSLDLDSVTLTVRHRGAPNEEAFIGGSEIAEIRPDGILLHGDGDEEGGFIPYHRIIGIRHKR